MVSPMVSSRKYDYIDERSSTWKAEIFDCVNIGRKVACRGEGLISRARELVVAAYPVQPSYTVRLTDPLPLLNCRPQSRR